LAAAWLRSWAAGANPAAVAAWPGDGSTGSVDVQLGGCSASGTDSHYAAGVRSKWRVLHLQSPHTPPGRSSPGLLRQCTPAMAKKVSIQICTQMTRFAYCSEYYDLLADKVGVIRTSKSKHAVSVLSTQYFLFL